MNKQREALNNYSAYIVSKRVPSIETLVELLMPLMRSYSTEQVVKSAVSIRQQMQQAQNGAAPNF